MHNRFWHLQVCCRTNSVVVVAILSLFFLRMCQEIQKIITSVTKNALSIIFDTQLIAICISSTEQLFK